MLLILFGHLANAYIISDSGRSQFAFDEDGCPLLPDVELNNITIDSLRTMLVDFMGAQWRE